MGQQRKTGRVRPKVFMRSSSERASESFGCPFPDNNAMVLALLAN